MISYYCSLSEDHRSFNHSSKSSEGPLDFHGQNTTKDIVVTVDHGIIMDRWNLTRNEKKAGTARSTV